MLIQVDYLNGKSERFVAQEVFWHIPQKIVVVVDNTGLHGRELDNVKSFEVKELCILPTNIERGSSMRPPSQPPKPRPIGPGGRKH